MRIRELLVALAVLPSAAMASQSTTIPEIQGPGHSSPLDGRMVRFEGVVTQLRDASFYVQDPVGDGDDMTSDGILVRRKPSGLSIGDMVRIEGVVEEQQGKLIEFTQTTIKDLVYKKIGQGVLPNPVIVGGEHLPPTETIVSTARGFDPSRSGADFFETLEGMMVEVKSPIVVGPMKGDIFYVVADQGKNATGMNSLGGITATPGDANPERIRVKIDKPLLPTNFQVSLGDTFTSLKGAVTTDGGAYGIQLSEPSGYTAKAWTWTSVASPPEADVLTIASYNVENLDTRLEDVTMVPSKDDIDDDVGDGKFAAIAKHIVGLLGSPDVVALQEVQDDDGGEYSDAVGGGKTLQALLDAIVVEGGPIYKTISLDPIDDAEGGQPGANIRVAFLYNPERVATDPANARRIEDASFERTRLPLAVPFIFTGRQVMVINVHFSSKGGSDPLYGKNQPPKDATLAARTEQARAVRAFIRKLPADANRSVLVVGDFNTLWYEEPMLLLTGGDPAMSNLALVEPPEQRISYVFDGNSQSLDQVVALLGANQSAALTTVHVNSVMPESKQTSDHDPKYVKLKVH
ncbi:endonuclease/exonuclease/phosphatase family protein (plasmid) [Rhizobium leguminosarum]